MGVAGAGAPLPLRADLLRVRPRRREDLRSAARRVACRPAAGALPPPGPRGHRPGSGPEGRVVGFFELFSGALTALYAVIKDYGLSIILLTLLVRVILVPLSVKQVRSMREMQRIQPEIKKLQQKYKGNK